VYILFTDFVKIELIQIRKSILLERGKESQGTRTDLLPTIGKKLESHNTQEIIATELGICTGKLAQAEVVIKKATPEI
jgi:hypothetical protein